MSSTLLQLILLSIVLCSIADQLNPGGYNTLQSIPNRFRETRFLWKTEFKTGISTRLWQKTDWRVKVWLWKTESKPEYFNSTLAQNLLQTGIFGPQTDPKLEYQFDFFGKRESKILSVAQIAGPYLLLLHTPLFDPERESSRQKVEDKPWIPDCYCARKSLHFHSRSE